MFPVLWECIINRLQLQWNCRKMIKNRAIWFENDKLQSRERYWRPVLQREGQRWTENRAIWFENDQLYSLMGYSLTECSVHVRLCMSSGQLVHAFFVTNHWLMWSQYKSYGILWFGTGVWAQALNQYPLVTNMHSVTELMYIVIGLAWAGQWWTDNSRIYE